MVQRTSKCTRESDLALVLRKLLLVVYFGKAPGYSTHHRQVILDLIYNIYIYTHTYITIYTYIYIYIYTYIDIYIDAYSAAVCGDDEEGGHPKGKGPSSGGRLTKVFRHTGVVRGA